MTKKEIVKTIAEEVGLPLATVHAVVQATFNDIIETLVQEGRVELRRFGLFQVKVRKPRIGRNPRTGEAVMVPRRNAVVFKPGLEMEAQVNRMKHMATVEFPKKHSSDW